MIRTLPLTAGLCLLALALPLRARAVSYTDFPPQLQAILGQRLRTAKTNGGFCLAGRVTFSDGATINDGRDLLVNFLNSIDVPLAVYSNGWFIGRSPLPANYRHHGKIAARAFAYDPLDFPVEPATNQITYVALTLNRTPEPSLSALQGKVIDDQGSPIPEARLSVRFNFAFVDKCPSQTLTTGLDGKFVFPGLTPANYWLSASRLGTSGDTAVLSVPPGGVLNTNLTLYPVRTINFSYLCQTNGTRDFTTRDLLRGTLTWTAGSGPMNFPDQVIGWGKSPDLNLEQLQNKLFFRCPYIGPKTNGYYDAGDVSFNSVTNASATGYSTQRSPCQVGHVYVVKTMNGFYAKLIVKSDD